MRKYSRLTLCLPVLCLFGTAASAQVGEKQDLPRVPAGANLPDSHQSFLHSFAHDEWTIWSSPFRGSNYDSRTVRKYVVPFALVSAALLATDRKSADVLPNSRDQAVWSGRVSQAGASYTLAGASGAMFLLGKATGNRHTQETGWLALQAIAHTQLVVFGMKQITNRRRPVTDNVPSRFWDGGDSFPSGHAATSFAVATVFAYEYRHHLAIPILAYSIAAGVSASRVSARRHWASDIFVGGSTGFLIGRFLYKLHHNPDLPGSPVHHNGFARFIPDMRFGGRSLGLWWSL